ncbi:MAG TPA: ATP-binding protein [Polyangiaceae bacterium]
MRIRLLFIVLVSSAIWLSQWLLYERDLFPTRWHSELYRATELCLCAALLAFLSRRHRLELMEWVATLGLSLLAVAHAGAILAIAPSCVVPFTLTLEWGQMVIAFAALLSFRPTLVLLCTTWLVGFISTSIRAKWDTDFSDHIVLAGIYGVVLASIRGFDALRLREFKGRYELDLAHRALQAAERARTRLFINLSHDFRTPLALIHSEAALLQRSVAADSGRAALERIQLNSAALAELTNELLELARLDAGRARVAPLNFELAPLLREQASQFDGRVAKLELQLEAADCAVFADPAHVRRIVVNLIANSARAARSRICVRCAVVDARVMVDVVDDGPGVPESRRRAIFERFTSFDAAGSVASGIGLPVARELSELNGGSLWLVEDAPLTTFRMALPRATGPVVELAQVMLGTLPQSLSATVDEPSVTGRSGARSLLVVEDHPDMRRLLNGLLGEHFQVHAVADVAGARRALRELTPDAILCDVLLPDGDGFDVLSELRADRHFDGVPLLFVSALATAEQRTRGLAAGVDDYVTKPFHAQELIARVHLACERAAQRRRALDLQRHEFLAELHDGVTASLSRAALLLDAAKQDGAAPALLGAAADAVRDGLSEARTVLSLTSAGTVPWSVVVARVRAQLDESLSFGLRLDLQVDNDGSASLLSAIEAHTLERAARELVTNAVKHAAARRLSALLVARQGQALFSVSDDGVGSGSSGTGSGLAILKRRVVRLSGTLSISPQAPAGTSVSLAFPISLARSVEPEPEQQLPPPLELPLSAAL